MMTSYTYTFPKIIDPDYGAKTSILLVEDSATGALPTFITLKKSSLIINPKSIEKVNSYVIKVRITDKIDES
jgi:hypothetical protein